MGKDNILNTLKLKAAQEIWRKERKDNKNISTNIKSLISREKRKIQ